MSDEIRKKLALLREAFDVMGAGERAVHITRNGTQLHTRQLRDVVDALAAVFARWENDAVIVARLRRIREAAALARDLLETPEKADEAREVLRDGLAAEAVLW